VVQEEAPAEGAMIVVCVAVAPPRLVVLAHHFHQSPTGPRPWGLLPVREWRWSWGIPPLTRQATSPWVKP
jgi:hypothetical protein